MKTKKIILSVFMLLLLICFANAKNSGFNNQKNDTIKKTIYDYKGYDEVKKFIDALKTGDQKLIQGMCKEKGYKSLLNTFPTHHKFEKSFNQLYEELSTAEFHPGVSEEMIDYYHFSFDNKRRYKLGFIPLKEGHKLIIFERERNVSNKPGEVKWGQ
ncbi:MAG: hypothetical protein HY958_07985 [Bacteroidia bacterium]|nr:hypothetical protein [Bacteroidia bacterium]